MRSIDGKSRVVVWDLETSNLDADFGFILCAGWKCKDGENLEGCACHGDFRNHIISIRDQWQYHVCTACGKPHRIGRVTDDRYVVREMSKVLMTADIHVTYNGKRYDWKWIQTRRWIFGWDLLPRVPHIDLLYTAKATFRTRSKSLKHISTLDRTIEVSKTPVSGPEWVAAVAGDERALSYVETHCKNDVLVLEHEYDRMKGVVWMHPRVTANAQACRYCGSTALQSRGYEVTALKNRKRRVQCRNCGRWDHYAITVNVRRSIKKAA